MFQHLCEEREGTVLRTVSFMQRDIQTVLRVADSMNKVRHFVESGNLYSVLVDRDNLLFTVDDVGLIAVLPIGQMLHCHITFWDGRLRGRERLCQSLAEFVTRLSGKRLFTAIPEELRIVLAFARRAGFEETGHHNGAALLVFPNYTE